MTEETSGITTTESIGIKGKRVGEAILKFDPGLALGDALGKALKGPMETTCYTLLLAKQLPRVLGIFPRGRPVIGDLRIEPHGKDKRWSMSVYGRDNSDRLEKLAKELVSTFSCNIHIRLESEDSRKERTWVNE